MATAPFRTDDGDWNILKKLGHDISYPFADRGDYASFEYIVKYEQDKSAFRPLAGMTRQSFPLGDAYFVDQGDITDKGFGICEFTRTFASIPATRTEGESIVFVLTIISTPGPASVRSDITMITTADVVYEYFGNEKPLSLIAPRYYASELGIPDRIVVQDSEVGIYKGKIYYRKTYYADWASLRRIINI